MNLEELTILKARKLLDSKQVSAKELTEAYLEEIEKRDGKLNSFLEVYDDVLIEAEKAQKLIDAGESESLTGIPISVKDVILVRGKRASGGSKILENYKATYSATAVDKLLKERAVLLGRTNCDEFAMGSSTENSAYGVTRNPFDEDRVAGGSSGGSAASVAANFCLASLGSDTGGSVRAPASFCGIVGLKPTYGRVSRYGLMAMGSSLDCIGPLAKTVTDTEIVFKAVKGRDMMDSTSIDEKITPPTPSYFKRGEKGKIKIGVPNSILNQDGIAPDIKKNFEVSVGKFKDLGFEIQEINLENADKCLAIYYIVMPAEVSSNMARYDGIKYGFSDLGAETLLDVYKDSRGKGFGPEVRRRILLGTYVLSSGYYDAYYSKAMGARRVIGHELSETFKKVDLILLPTMPAPAWKIGEKSSPLETYLADIFTVIANVAQIPAISLPSGFSEVDGKKLPLGIQLMAPKMGEDLLFQAGKAFLNETH